MNFFKFYADLIIRARPCISFAQSSVSHIISTWVNFLFRKFSEVSIWPSRQQIHYFMPAAFESHYPTTRVIIDATEIYIQRPSDPESQQVTFSSYKNHNTAKALIGITPSGVICFISKLYGGSISDRELFIETGLINKLDVGDSDKGFAIADLLQVQGMSLNIPPDRPQISLHKKS